MSKIIQERKAIGLPVYENALNGKVIGPKDHIPQTVFKGHEYKGRSHSGVSTKIFCSFHKPKEYHKSELSLERYPNAMQEGVWVEEISLDEVPKPLKRELHKLWRELRVGIVELEGSGIRWFG